MPNSNDLQRALKLKQAKLTKKVKQLPETHAGFRKAVKDLISNTAQRQALKQG